MSVSSHPPQATGSSAWLERIASIWWRITQPHPSIDESERRRVRAFSEILAMLIGISILSTILTFVIEGWSYNFSVTLTAAVSLVLVYTFVGRRNYFWAPVATVIVIYVSVTSVAIDARQVWVLDFLTLGIVGGSLFLPSRVIITLSFLAVMIVLLFSSLVPNALPKDIAAIAFLLASTGGLAILGTRLNRRDLTQIEEHTLILIKEIEERKRADAALQEQRQRLSEAQHIAHLGSFEWDVPTNTVIWSDELYRIYGLEPQSFDATFEAFLAQVHEDDRERVQNQILSAVQQGASFGMEERIVRPDGSVRTLRTQGEVIVDATGAPVKLRGVCWDISERKQAETERAQLYAAEHRARQIAETLQAANLALTRSLDLETVLETFLDCLEQLIPYDTANVMLFEGEDTLAVRALRGYEAFTDAARTEAITFDVRHTPTLRGLIEEQRSVAISDTREFPGWEQVAGAEHVISWLGIPLVAGGKTIGIYSLDKTEANSFTDEHRRLAEALTAQAAVAIQNALLAEEGKRYAAELEQRIAERQEAERTLQSERDFAQLVMNSMGQGLTVADNETRLEYVNPAFAKIVGRTPDEVIGLYARDIIVPEDQTTLAAQVALRHTGVGASYEIRVKHMDGHSVPVLITAVPYKKENNFIGSVTVITDLTERKQAENALRQSEEKYRTLVENSLQGVLISQNGRVVFANPAIEKLTGYTHAELLARTSEEVLASLHPDDLPRIRQREEARLAGEPIPDKIEYRIIRKDGTVRWVESHTVPYTYGGQPTRLTSMIDFTQRVEAEAQVRASEARFRGLFETAPDGNVIVNQDGVIVLANPQAETLFGYAQGEMAGVQLERLVPHRFAHHADLRQAYMKNPHTRAMGSGLELLARRQDGSEFPVEILLNAVEGPEGPLAMATVRDITERRRAEEDRLARQSAEAANLAKSEFLSRMSHELRTPMNSILGFAQLLEMSQKEPLSSTQYVRVEHILKAGQHLLNLINEVLEISRIEAGHLDISLEAVAVVQVASEVIDLTAPLADERQIHVHGEIDPEQKMYVTADLQRLKQVMINLLANAIKYNHKGGEVWLICESRPDGCQRISVRDNGPGIALEQQAKLFQPFERLGAERGEVTGTGLGLTLSKRLIDLMGGRIGVESAVGAGSTFWVELPVAAHPLNEEVPDSDAGPLPANYGQSHTILYIEDNLANYELVKQVLADESQVSLVWAIQGSIALDLARQHQPDLILLDLHLPDLQGIEVLAQLRQDEATRSIPVLVISADATPHQIERLLDTGADAYLTKPLNVPAFLQTVQMLLTKN